MPRVVSIGRLDLTSEGLLLLTNDGALARRLELPATGSPRRYRVRVHGVPDQRRLAALAKGITVDGAAYGPIEQSWIPARAITRGSRSACARAAIARCGALWRIWDLR